MPETIKVEPNTAKHPDSIGKFQKCPRCKTVFPAELPRCPVCTNKDEGYYLS